MRGVRKECNKGRGKKGYRRSSSEVLIMAAKRYSITVSVARSTLNTLSRKSILVNLSSST